MLDDGVAMMGSMVISSDGGGGEMASTVDSVALPVSTSGSSIHAPSNSSSGGTPRAPLRRSHISSECVMTHFRALRTQSASLATERSTVVSHDRSVWEHHEEGSSTRKSWSSAVPLGRVWARRVNSFAVGGVDNKADTSPGRSIKGR